MGYGIYELGEQKISFDQNQFWRPFGLYAAICPKRTIDRFSSEPHCTIESADFIQAPTVYLINFSQFFSP